MKRLLFDVYELAAGAGNSIGIYNYARHLFHALVAKRRPDLTIILVCNHSALNDFMPKSSETAIEHHIVSQRRPGIARRLLWTTCEVSILCRRLRVDIYFSPRGFLPLNLGAISPNTTTVVTIHDLIPLWYREVHPAYFGKLQQWFVCNALLRSARNADKVLTVSNASAREIREKAKTRKEIWTIYNGVRQSAPLRSRIEGNYIFAMTSALPHKNSPVLIEGYALYRASVSAPMRLIICGIQDPQIPGIEVVNKLSDAELQSYYVDAKVFIFMSLIEGFGFPPLEAMGYGTVTICSDIPALREITKNIARYVPATRSDLLAIEIASAVAESNQPSESDEKRRREVAQSYSWEACADRFVDVAASSV